MSYRNRVLELPGRLFLAGAALGFVLVRYWFLPMRLAESQQAGSVLAWTDIASTTAGAMLIGALGFAAAWSLIVHTLLPARRTLGGLDRREQDVITHLEIKK